MIVEKFEGYTLTDELRIGNIYFAIGECNDGNMSYVTVESGTDKEYGFPHYQTSRLAAEVDLLKRASMQVKCNLWDMSVGMGDHYSKDGDLFV